MIRKPIEIEIYVHNDDTEALSKLDIDYDMDFCDVELFTFYRIDAIYPSVVNGNENGCFILLGGQELTSPMSYSDLKELISKHI